MIRHRLTNLEKALRIRTDHPCPLCFGHPVCVEDVRGGDPPGHRRPIERDRARVTDDFRCRSCGAWAVVITFPRVAAADRAALNSSALIPNDK